MQIDLKLHGNAVVNISLITRDKRKWYKFSLNELFFNCNNLVASHLYFLSFSQPWVGGCQKKRAISRNTFNEREIVIWITVTGTAGSSASGLRVCGLCLFVQKKQYLNSKNKQLSLFIPFCCFHFSPCFPLHYKVHLSFNEFVKVFIV